MHVAAHDAHAGQVSKPGRRQGGAVGIVSPGDIALERDPKSALAEVSAAEGNT